MWTVSCLSERKKQVELSGLIASKCWNERRVDIDKEEEEWGDLIERRRKRRRRRTLVFAVLVSLKNNNFAWVGRANNCGWGRFWVSLIVGRLFREFFFFYFFFFTLCELKYVIHFGFFFNGFCYFCNYFA